MGCLRSPGDSLTQPPRDLGRPGGIFPAIVGTLYLVPGAILIALPLGVGAAIYLVEYTGKDASPGSSGPC